MSRQLLHKNKLDDFKGWCVANGFEVKPPPPSADFWLLFCVQYKLHWMGVFQRVDMKEHVSTDRRLDPLVSRYCRERKKANKEQA